MFTCVRVAVVRYPEKCSLRAPPQVSPAALNSRAESRFPALRRLQHGTVTGSPPNASHTILRTQCFARVFSLNAVSHFWHHFRRILPGPVPPERHWANSASASLSTMSSRAPNTARSALAMPSSTGAPAPASTPAAPAAARPYQRARPPPTYSFSEVRETTSRRTRRTGRSCSTGTQVRCEVKGHDKRHREAGQSDVQLPVDRSRGFVDQRSFMDNKAELKRILGNSSHRGNGTKKMFLSRRSLRQPIAVDSTSAAHESTLVKYLQGGSSSQNKSFKC